MPNPFTQNDQENEEFTLTGQIPSAPPMPTFNPGSGLPPQPPVAPLASPVAPAPAMPSAPLTPPAKYGLDQQMAVEQDIAKRRSGFLPNLALAGTGFADALMQGVARAGPSNFQSTLQGRMDKSDEGIRGAMEKGAAGEAAQRKQAMEDAKMDPSSHLSKIAQRSATPTLTAMGLTPEEISAMPAALISEAITQRLSLEEIRGKAEETRALREQTGLYQQGMLENTRRGQAQTAEQAAAAQRAAGKKSQMDAAEAVLKRSGNAKVFGIPIPFTSDVSGKVQKDAQKVLVEGMNPSTQTFSSEQEVEAANLPPGTIVTINGRKARVK